MRIIQPSKINLTLKITGLRADGRHDIFSSFLPLSEPFDAVDIAFDRPRDTLEIHCACPGVPEDMSNLACRAACAYAEAAGISPCWSITVEKHIPAAAGMGGGSTDAAGVLTLLNRRYGALADDQLHRTAARLGADVPYFLAPEPAFMDEDGGHFAMPLHEMPDLPLLLVSPGFPVSTAWSYGAFDESLSGPEPEGFAEEFSQAAESGDWKKLAGMLHNDLSTALLRKFPLLREIMDTLTASGAAGCGVTGSGPVIFAIGENRDDLRRAAAAVEENFPAAAVIPALAGAKNGVCIYE